MTDSDAIARWQRGDLSGLEELVERHQRKAVQVVYLIVQDEPLAEDIVVDTFLRLHRRIGTFQADRPFEPYLMRSLVNAALNAMRHRTVSLDDDATRQKVDRLLAQAESLEDLVEANELRREIQQAIAALSPSQRAAIVQRYYLGFSEAEIALALNAPRGTVKWLLNRGRERLGKLLSRERNAP